MLHVVVQNMAIINMQGHDTARYALHKIEDNMSGTHRMIL